MSSGFVDCMNRTLKRLSLKVGEIDWYDQSFSSLRIVTRD